MPDATHDIVDDGFHEIHLSGKQLVFLFMATTVVSVVIFLTGVHVGRTVRAQQTTDQLTDPTTAAASALPPAIHATSDSGPPAVEPPAPPAESDELSYKKRLEGDAASESLNRPVEAAPLPRAIPRPEAAPSSAPPAAAGASQPGTWVIQVHALRDRTTATGIVRRLAGKGYPAFLVASGPPTGTYKVQVGRYKDREEALRVIERLKKEEQFNPWITR